MLESCLLDPDFKEYNKKIYEHCAVCGTSIYYGDEFNKVNIGRYNETVCLDCGDMATSQEVMENDYTICDVCGRKINYGDDYDIVKIMGYSASVCVECAERVIEIGWAE